jgi:predicted RND superfamily exporter protein
MGFVHRRILKSVLSIVRHPWIALAVVAASVTVCSLLASTLLNISTDQNELFSAKPVFFRNYLLFIGRFTENEAIYVVIEPRDPSAKPSVEQWAAVADHITDRLRSIPEVLSAYCRVPIDQLGRQGLLFENPKKLPQEFAAVQQLAQLTRIWGAKPSFEISLLGRTPIERFLSGVAARPTDENAAFMNILAGSWAAAIRHPDQKLGVGNGVVDFRAIGATDPTQLGYFYVPDETDRSRHRVLVRVYPQRIFNTLTAVTRTINVIRRTAVDAGADFPDFQIGVTGRPALDADQMAATDADSHKAEVISLIVVFIGVAVMLRSLWMALAAEIALGVGIGWTFGWATATIGKLNLLSLVFLIALIGIGMDYLVQILTRYRLEARRYHRPQEVWVRVFHYVGPPINTACLGAAGAFLVAIFTDFRGAAELGIIAGGGLILCLIAGYVVLPALMTIFPPKLKPLDVSERFKPAVPQKGMRRLALPAVWAGLLAVGSHYMPSTHFDPGLISLQAPNLPSVQLIKTLQTWVAVALSKDTQKLREARAQVADLPVVASTESILDAQDNAQWLRAHASEIPKIDWTPPTPVDPGDLSKLADKADHLANVFEPKHAPFDAAKSAAAGSLRLFADEVKPLSGSAAVAAASQLSDWQEIFVNEVRDQFQQFQPGDLDLKTVPRELRSHYVSDDGYCALYIYPRDNLWDDAKLVEFMSSVEEAIAKIPDPPMLTGIASNVYHTTGAIHAAFIQSTIYALILIFILVLLDFRRLGPTLGAISVLAMGLPMLVALMGFFGTNWNFANFFGLPILIGAGHEYGVFMVHRYLEARRDPRRAWRRWDPSDRALLLCAYITTSSFGFFWLLAHHQGLKSLGLVMGLGTLCIYLATIMMLRPILKWKLEKPSGGRKA